MGCPVYTPRRRTFFSQNLGSKQHTLAFSHTCEAQLVISLLHLLGRLLSVVMAALVKVSKNVFVPESKCQSADHRKRTESVPFFRLFLALFQPLEPKFIFENVLQKIPKNMSKLIKHPFQNLTQNVLTQPHIN